MTEPPRDSQDPQYPRYPDEPAGEATDLVSSIASRIDRLMAILRGITTGSIQKNGFLGKEPVTVTRSADTTEVAFA